MGDMADFFIEQQLAQGRSPVGSWRPRPKHPICAACGCKQVHWRLFDGYYKMADNQRQHPGNRFVEHRCPTSADGFEDQPV